MKDQDRPKPAAADSDKANPGVRFVERMFSGMAHSSARPPVPPAPASEAPFVPLREHRASPGTRYQLQRPAAAPALQPDSPATGVMTDLTRVTAITIREHATLAEANEVMIERAVRSLFVVGDQSAMVGMVTSTDLLGERPIQLSQQLGIRRDEITVRDVMTPADRLEAIDLEDVLQARVGDVVATLKQSGRQHALVIERVSSGTAGAVQMVRGIFSLTEIARRLGVPIQATHDIPRTFAEIEAAIGS